MSKHTTITEVKHCNLTERTYRVLGGYDNDSDYLLSDGFKYGTKKQDT
jgi:hypothetical protein